MEQIITKIEREKGYSYIVDKNGNVKKCSYNWFKDPYTLVAIAILILGSLYYIQIKDMKTTEKNFEPMCLEYISLRNEWMEINPGKTPTIKEVFEIRNNRIEDKINFTFNNE